MNKKASSLEGEVVTFLRSRDYRLVRELGGGACGRTVLLFDDQIGEHFVCKKYHPYSESARSQLFANFVREIKLLHNVHHPNVVRVFNHYLYPGNFTGYILMEFVDGTLIDEYLAANPEKVSDVFLQVIDGFAHLEFSSILHRDIRPGNLMVATDGTAKIIDLGFGKHVASSEDYEKSISLNWWCDPPKEFKQSRYDFTTEVYFVGKLFERILRDSGISHFPYADVLQGMCEHDPEHRVASFSIALQRLRNDHFQELSFSLEDRRAYRNFADELCSHIVKIESGAKYVDDLQRIERQLRDVYQKSMLEETVPDCASVLRCFFRGVYYYRNEGFPVSAVKAFADVLRSSTPERGQVILANLHTRLDAIPRYEKCDIDTEDIPF